MAEQFRLYLLGGFRLEKNGTPVKLARQKSKALLAYLALFPGAHTREFLATLFFPDALDADARKNLRVLFAELYKTLGKEFFSDDRESVELNTEKIRVDAKEFMRDWRLETGDSISSPQSPISLYRGDLLPELYDDWVLQKRDELRERYVELLLHVVESYRAQSEYVPAVEWAQKVLQTDRANERAHQHLMFLHAAQGDRTAALNQFEACVTALDEELGVEPSAETIALAKKIKQQKTGAASDATRLTNLPKALTSFVGREREMEEIRGMLGGGRRAEGGARVSPRPSLLTLTGPGGSGKTRLTLQIGRALVEEFEDGVWFVDLAPLSDARLVPQQIAKALGVLEQPNEAMTQTLVNALRERELLLILDNCEHLVDACAHIAEALISGSPVSILATSREGLNIAGEQVYPVAPLAVPRAEKFSLAQLAQEFSAVRLFVDRARLAQPQFVLDDANAAYVIQICQRLDGIPLAIELAAARAKQMNVRDIAARLDQRFDLLVGARTALPRQQTLRALIDWSYDLLNHDERMLFRRLSVFAGGWTIESAEEICADDGAMNSSSLPRAKILDALLRLVDKSLVVRTGVDETRYTMLETIREYAYDKLRREDDLETMLARHYAYFAELADQAEPFLNGSQQVEWLDRLEMEMDNLRAALRSALQQDQVNSHTASSTRLAGALGGFWHMREYVTEGDAWVSQALAASNQSGSPRIRARTFTSAGTMAWRKGEYQRAAALHAQALELYRELQDPTGQAFALNNLSVQVRNLGKFEEALAYLKEAALQAQQGSDSFVLSTVWNNLGIRYLQRKNFTQAEAAFAQSLYFARQINAYFSEASALHNLGDLALARASYEEALTWFGQSQAIAEKIGALSTITLNFLYEGLTYLMMGNWTSARQRIMVSLRQAQKSADTPSCVRCLQGLAWLEIEQANPKRATILASVYEAQRSLGDITSPTILEKYNQSLSLLQEKLDANEFAAAWAQGTALSLEQAIAFALVGE